VTDNQTWQAPVTGGATPPPTAQPGYGPPPTLAPPGTPHGWTPPPKPGLIPLRPMGLGTILGASFLVMRRNPRATLGPALILSAAITIIVALGVAAYVAAFSRVLTATSYDDADAFAAGALLVSLLLVVLGIAIVVVATAVLQSIIVVEVARASLGEKLKLGQIWRIFRGRLWAVIGYTLLIALAIAIFVGLFFVVTFAVIAVTTLGTASTSSTSPDAIMGVMFATFGVTILVSLLGGLFWLWLSTKLAFVPAAIVLERRSIRASIVRSWTLTRGYFWRTLGIILLVGVMVWIASQIVAVPVSFASTLALPLLIPTGGSPDPMGAIVVGIVFLVVTSALTTVTTAIGMVLQSATSSLLYIDLRMRKEGLDLELSRFVEARETGADVADPYLPHAPAFVPVTTPPAPVPGA
jgi:membrane-anchored glycerophosphoryl diester phosphodiesterase (GDPDase)